MAECSVQKPAEFQSTLLIRGATRASLIRALKLAFQSTLLIRGATRGAYRARCASLNFNPRSSYEERQDISSSYLPACVFQSTLLIRGATGIYTRTAGSIIISIHAPHTRSDKQLADDKRGRVFLFQSTLLIRGATAILIIAVCVDIFQSTLLIRGATIRPLSAYQSYAISIHAPHTRSDPTTTRANGLSRQISIHAPHTRSDG